MSSPKREAERVREIFRAYLASRNLNFSQSREIILAWVLRSSHHFGAEELATDLDSSQDRVARGPVYRTLQLLEESGVIAKVHGRVRHRYELIVGNSHHDHLICRRCGRMIEFTDRKLPRPACAIAVASGFSPSDCHIQIHGLCEDCRNA